MLSRTMGLHHVQICPADTGAEDKLERAKVLRSLYVQDRNLCITSGAVSWLPSHDCKIASQLKAAVERQAPYADCLQLSIIQDDVYRLTHARGRRKSGSSSKSHATMQSLEQQLSEYASTFGVFDCETPFHPRQAMITLEFLATRILALKLSSKPEYLTRIRQDARASCLLLLIAHGEQDEATVEAFYSTTSREPTASPRKKSIPTSETGMVPFGSMFDSFSVPAFFILLEDLVRAPDEKDITQHNADLELLRKVSACYSLRTGRLQSNNYHRRVSWVFEQLLNLLELLKKAQQQPADAPLPPVPVAEMIPQHVASHMSPFQPDMMDFPHIPVGTVQGQMPDLPPTPSPSASLSWDNWITMSSALVPTSPFSAANMASCHSSDTPDLLAQMLDTSHSMPGASGQPAQWPTSASGTSNVRKRRKTQEDSEHPNEENGPSPLSDFLVSGQELPFHLIS
jgi:hypothetical protein